MFFERFCMLCMHKGVKPSKACEEMGISKGNASNWRAAYKKGEDSKPSMKIAKQIAQYFDVSLDYLLGNNTPSLLEELGNEPERPMVFHDDTTIDLTTSLILTEREKLLVEAYRRHPDLQAIVDQALGLSELLNENKNEL